MKTYFVIGSTDGADKKMYYWKKSTHSIFLDNILEAHKFESAAEACKVAIDNFYFGFSIISIADCTLEKMRKEINEGDYSLFNKFHDPLYTTI